MYLSEKIKEQITSPLIRSLYKRARKKMRIVKKAFIDVYSQDHPGIYLNWNISSPRWDNMAKVHWCVTRVSWRERKLYSLLSFFAWPAKAVFLASSMTRKHGRHIKMKSGLNLRSQFITQVWLALRHCIAPRAYYFYGLYEEENRKRAPFYIQDHEILQLMRLVNGSSDYQIFDDKRQFFAECKQHGLPTIPIIAEFESGTLKKWQDGSDHHLPGTDLFAKPALGKCGNGVKAYSYENPGQYRCDDGTLRTEEGLLKELSDLSRKTPYILQERYRSHTAIAALSPKALCTSRIVTCRMPDGRCEDIVAIFKMPSGDCCTDNFSTGGIAISIDKQNGMLGSAISKGLDAERIDLHPETGRRINGFRIPHWQDVIGLCLRAHSAFPAYTYIGWDIAVTKDGPILIEGNLRWGVESMQRALWGPLGETRFTESLLQHVYKRKCLNVIFRRDFFAPESGDSELPQRGYLAFKE